MSAVGWAWSMCADVADLARRTSPVGTSWAVHVHDKEQIDHVGCNSGRVVDVWMFVAWGFACCNIAPTDRKWRHRRGWLGAEVVPSVADALVLGEMGREGVHLRHLHPPPLCVRQTAVLDHFLLRDQFLVAFEAAEAEDQYNDMASAPSLSAVLDFACKLET